MEKPQSRWIVILRANPPQSVPWFRGNAVVAGSPMLRFRYTEERIYPGDGVYALGWSSSGPPVASDSMEEPMEAIEDDPSGEFEYADEETEADGLGEEAEGWEVPRVRELAPAHLAKRGQNHYLISTLPRAEALKMHRLGVVGALWISLIGGLLLAGVLVMRYG